jgi:hypothetical protein
MSNCRSVARRVLCSLLLLSSAACTTMKTIHPVTQTGGSPFAGVEAGDTVRVRMKDGEQRQFVVQQVDGNALVAPNGATFQREDIVRLQKRTFSGKRTAFLAGGIFAGVTWSWRPLPLPP